MGRRCVEGGLLDYDVRRQENKLFINFSLLDRRVWLFRSSAFQYWPWNTPKIITITISQGPGPYRINVNFIVKTRRGHSIIYDSRKIMCWCHQSYQTWKTCHSIPEIINAVPKIKQGAATAVNRDCSELWMKSSAFLKQMLLLGWSIILACFFFKCAKWPKNSGGGKQQVNQLKSTAWPPRLCSGAQSLPTRNAKPHTINRESSQMKVQEPNLLKTGP